MTEFLRISPTTVWDPMTGVRQFNVGQGANGELVSTLDSGPVSDQPVGSAGCVSGNAVAATHPVVYLAHGYDPLTKPLGLEVMKILEGYGIEVINPFIRGEQALYDKYIQDGVDFPEYINKEIVDMDLAKIDQAQAIVAIPSTSSIGTFMEIFYGAYVQHKPVFTLWVHPPKVGGGFNRKHPWLAHLTNLFMSDREGFLAAIKGWADGGR